MAHVDALSRHVGTIAQGGTLEKENVLHEQGKNDFCCKAQVPTVPEKNIFLMTMVFYIDAGRAETISWFHSAVPARRFVHDEKTLNS